MNPIALSFVPSQMSTKKSVPNPREFSPLDWRERLFLDAPYWTLPADQQSDNYRDLNEGYKMVGSSMFGLPSNPGLVYGHRIDQLNPLDQEQTNRPVNQIYKVTRIQDVNGVNKISRNLPQQYPVPTYYRQSFEGSTPNMRRAPLGARYPNTAPQMFG